MAGVELLGSPEVFRSNLLKINHSPSRIVSENRSRATTPENNLKQIDFENFLKESMVLPDKNSTVIKNTGDLEKKDSEVADNSQTQYSEQIAIKTGEILSLNTVTQPLNKYISPDLVRSSYKTIIRAAT
jgi:hypothetical protein